MSRRDSTEPRASEVGRASSPAAGRPRPARLLRGTEPRESASAGYTGAHAASGVHADFPEIETWPNQYPGREYEIEIGMPEFTSVCPKTGLPDSGDITLTYVPDKLCLELKSLKMYTLAYRNLGIFQENVVNRMLDDIVKACKPIRATVTGEFTPRGGLSTLITASYDRRKSETRER